MKPTESPDAPALTYVPVNLADGSVQPRPCTMAAALEVVGERWSLLALREMSYGVHTFAKIAAYTGASRDILTERLRKLEAAGVIERRKYNKHPARYEYHLTQAGRELFPVMVGLLAWGAKWAVDTPVVVFEHTCGHDVAVGLECEHCGKPVTRSSLAPKAILGQV